MRGYTLIELVIVIAILGLLAAIGWANMQSSVPRYRLIRAAKKLQSDILSMRSMAVRSNRQTKITFLASGGDCSNPSNWGGKWSLSVGNKSFGSDEWDLLPEDSFDDFSDDDQSLGIVDIGPNGEYNMHKICLNQWETLSGGASQNSSDSIVFNTRGWLANPNSDFSSSGSIELSLYNQKAREEFAGNSLVVGDSQSHHSVTVQVSRAGLVRILTYDKDPLKNEVGTSSSTTITQ